MAKGNYVTPEQLATQKVLLQASSMGARLLRNNSGAFYDESGRLVRFGVGNDGSKASKDMAFGDYIGVLPVVITPDMVGKTIGAFFMTEIKPEGHLVSTLKKAETKPESREAKQFNAIQWVNDLGGCAWFASCEADVEAIINRYLWDLTNG